MLEKISKIQKEMGVLVKDTQAYNYKYVDLAQIQEKLNPLLEEHKLVLTQPLQIDSQGKTYLNTIINDLGSKEKLESAIYLPDNVEPQKMGSAITYYRRYSLLSLLNLTTEDDDGASASNIRNNRDDF
jgi:hypothetical protein